MIRIKQANLEIKTTKISGKIEVDKEYYDYKTREEEDTSPPQKVRKSLKWDGTWAQFCIYTGGVPKKCTKKFYKNVKR